MLHRQHLRQLCRSARRWIRIRRSWQTWTWRSPAVWRQVHIRHRRPFQRFNPGWRLTQMRQRFRRQSRRLEVRFRRRPTLHRQHLRQLCRSARRWIRIRRSWQTWTWRSPAVWRQVHIRHRRPFQRFNPGWRLTQMRQRFRRQSRRSEVRFKPVTTYSRRRPQSLRRPPQPYCLSTEPPIRSR